MQLAGVLRKAIAAGKYPPGTATPSITTLSQEYGHARQTCSKALGVLVKEGLLIRYPGLGYYVAGKPGDPSRPTRERGRQDGRAIPRQQEKTGTCNTQRVRPSLAAPGARPARDGCVPPAMDVATIRLIRRMAARPSSLGDPGGERGTARPGARTGHAPAARNGPGARGAGRAISARGTGRRRTRRDASSGTRRTRAADRAASRRRAAARSRARVAGSQDT